MQDKQARISISERNEHYFDADEEYTVEVSGTLSLKLDAGKLEKEDLGEEDLTDEPRIPLSSPHHDR